LPELRDTAACFQCCRFLQACNTACFQCCRFLPAYNTTISLRQLNLPREESWPQLAAVPAAGGWRQPMFRVSIHFTSNHSSVVFAMLQEPELAGAGAAAPPAAGCGTTILMFMHTCDSSCCIRFVAGRELAKAGAAALPAAGGRGHDLQLHPQKNTLSQMSTPSPRVFVMLQEESWPELARRHFLLLEVAAMVKALDSSGGLGPAVGGMGASLRGILSRPGPWC